MKKQLHSKVLFLCKRRVKYGISFGLINSATFVAEALNKLGIDSKVEMVTDGNSVDKAVHEYKPKICILEALWVTPRKLKELARLHPKVNFVVRMHSNTEFIAMEGHAFDWIAKFIEASEEYHNIYLSSNSARFVNDISACLGGHRHWVYTPNVYFPDHKAKKLRKPQKKEINIGCFGSIRPLKNHLEQAVAAIIFADSLGKKLNFFINSDRTEQQGERVLQNVRSLFENSKHQLVELPWKNHKDFLEVVSKMDVVMQVSFSETFCIVAADAVSVGIPLVASEEIEWISPSSQATPTCTYDIVSKLRRAYKSTVLPRINKFALQKHSELALVEWIKVVKHLTK